MAIDYAMRKALLSVCYTAKALTQALVAKAAAKQAKPEESTRPATDEPVDIDALAELLYGIYGQEVLEKVYDVIDAHEGKVEKAWTSGNEDQCPQCGKQYKLRCRCRIGDKQCENGHSWHSCPVHPDRIILGGGHGLGFGCHCQTAIEKAWRETDHPRGEGGRFIPKGSPEARAAATDAVKKAIKGDRTLHPQNLMNHLSILTVKQIRALAREHGKRVPSAIKEDLHRALRSLVGNAANAVVPVEPEKPRDLPLPMEMLREGERSEGRLRRLADADAKSKPKDEPAKAEGKVEAKPEPVVDHGVMRDKVEEVLHGANRWHSNYEEAKGKTGTKQIDDVAKEGDSRYAMAKTVTDTGWLTNGKYAVKATPAMVEHAQAKGYDKIDGRTPNVNSVLPKSKGSPARVVAGKGGNKKQLLVQDDDGGQIIVNAQLMANVLAVHPKVELETSARQNMVIARDKKSGEIVGIVMGMGEYLKGDKVEKVGPDRQSIADVAEPGPFTPETVFDEGGRLTVGKGTDREVSLTVTGTKDAGYSLANTGRGGNYPTYPTMAEAKAAAREILAHAHGRDNKKQPIFLPKGAKAEPLGGSAKDHADYYSALKAKAKHPPISKSTIEIEGADGKKHSRELLKITDHFAVHESLPDWKGKDGGYDVVWMPDGPDGRLLASSWTKKSDAIAFAHMLENMPGIDWNTNPKTLHSVDPGKAKEFRSKVHNVTDAFSREEYHPDMGMIADTGEAPKKPARKPREKKPTASGETAKPDTDPGFTGTDSQGREWVNGRLVARQDETPLPERAAVSPSEEVPLPEQAVSDTPTEGGEVQPDEVPLPEQSMEEASKVKPVADAESPPVQNLRPEDVRRQESAKVVDAVRDHVIYGDPKSTWYSVEPGQIRVGDDGRIEVLRRPHGSRSSAKPQWQTMDSEEEKYLRSELGIQAAASAEPAPTPEEAPQPEQAGEVPAPEQGAGDAGKKEPWQMTRSELKKQHPELWAKIKQKFPGTDAGSYREYLQAAHSRGLDVPLEMRAEHIPNSLTSDDRAELNKNRPTVQDVLRPHSLSLAEYMSHLPVEDYKGHANYWDRIVNDKQLMKLARKMVVRGGPEDEDDAVVESLGLPKELSPMVFVAGLQEKKHKESVASEIARGNYASDKALESYPDLKAKQDWYSENAEKYWHHQSRRSAVESALKNGKGVPPEVLADYPDLAAKPSELRQRAIDRARELGNDPASTRMGEADKADPATIAPVDMPTDTTAGNAEAKLADATAHRDALQEQLTDLDRIDYQDAEQRARSRALSEQHAAASHHVRRHEELAQAARSGHPRAQEALDRLDRIGVPQSPNDERHRAAEAVMDALRTGGEMPAPFEPTPAPAPQPANEPKPDPAWRHDATLLTSETLPDAVSEVATEIINNNPKTSENRARELAAARIRNAIAAKVADIDDRVRSGKITDAEERWYDSIFVDGWSFSRELEKISGSRTILADADDPIANMPLSEKLEDKWTPAKQQAQEFRRRAEEVDASRLNAKRRPAPTPVPAPAPTPEPAGPQQSAFARGLRQVALPEGQRYVHDLPSADAFKLHRNHGDKADLLHAAGVRMQSKNGKVQAVVVGTDPADVEMRHDALRAAMGGDWSGIQSLAGQGKAAKAEAPPEPPPATVEPAKPSSHGASPDDIPLSLAHDAHYWVSFSPERRAKQTQGDYVSQMDADFQHLAKYANTPEKMEMLREEFARYRDGYRQRKIAWLSAKSRTASPMITGPARFPVERNRKRLETEHRRVEELLDFRERAIKAIKRKLQPELAPIKSSDPEAVSRLVEKVQQLEALQSMMKKVNDAHKRYLKDPKTLDASDLPEKYKERIRNYKPAYSWEPHPFPPYALSNNNASIRSVKERIASLEKMKAGGHKEVQYSGNVSVVEDPDAARIRIHFPGKPERATIDKLKREGFRWSPSEGAWQRHLNNTGRYAVESLLQSLGHTKTGEAEIKPGTDETDVEVPPMLEKPEIVETPPEGTPAALEEAGFTGTDSQGREWVNGEMVSKSHLAYLVKSAFPQMVQALTHVARVVKSAQPNEQPPSVEDVDQLLYGIYGQHTFDILGQLMAKKPITKAWNESDHPRDPKTKRFIPKGSSQARDAAIKAVKDAIHKPDVASAKELTDHLSILTAVQIRQLAREYGKKVPSAIKRDLHKVVEAFMGGSAGKGEATSEARPAEAPQGQKPAATPQQAPQEAAGKSEAKASGGDWRELDRTGNGDFEKAAKGAAATIAKYGLLGREDTGLLANSDAPFSKRINAAANLDVAVFDQMERAGQLQGFNNEYFRHMRQYDSWVDRPSSTEKLLGEYLDRTVTKTQHVINHMRKLHSQGEKLKLDSGQSVGFDTLADLYEGLLRPMAAETMKAFRSERAAAGIKDHSPKADPATIAPVSLPGEEPAAPAKAEGKSEGKSEAKPRAARKPAAAKKPAATTPAPAAQSGPRRAQHSDRAHAAIEKVRSKMGGPVVPINEVVDAMGGNVHEAHNHMIHLIESGKAHVSRHNSVGHLSPQERAKLLPIGDKHFGDDGKNYAGYLFMTS